MNSLNYHNNKPPIYLVYLNDPRLEMSNIKLNHFDMIPTIDNYRDNRIRNMSTQVSFKTLVLGFYHNIN